MREYLHTLYQFTHRWVVDDAKFRAAFGDRSTPLDDALAATVACVPQHRSRPDTHSHRALIRRRAMNTQTARRLAAAGMAGAATLAIAGFTALGSIFDYPQILKSDTAEILTKFRLHETAIVSWFIVLAVSAALLAPVASRWPDRQDRFHSNDVMNAAAASTAPMITNHTLISRSSYWCWMSDGNLAKTLRSCWASSAW